MKNSILGIGVSVILFVLIFACTKENENTKPFEEQINLKGEVNIKKQEADERGAYNVAQLLSYLHGYIKADVSEDFKYYENLPKRKEVNWYFENFKKTFKSGNEADNWVLSKIDSGEIFIFGITVNNIKVAALIFPEGLDLPERYKGGKGFFINGGRKACDDIFVRYGHIDGKNCSCHWAQSCHRGGCLTCPEKGANLNLERLFDLEQWIIDDRVFEKSRSVPVSEINIGKPLLELKRK